MPDHATRRTGIALILAILFVPLPLSAEGRRLWTAGAEQEQAESWLSKKTGGFLSDGKGASTSASRIELGPFGQLHLRTAQSLSVIDPVTGKELWSRQGEELLPVPGTPYALTWDGEELGVIDVESGDVRWTVSKESSIGGLEGFYSFVPIGDLGIVLLFGGKWRQTYTDVVAAELASGRPLWKSSELLLGNVQKGGGGPAMSTLHPPILDGDGVVLFLDSTGPVKFDPTNGKVVWRSIPFQKAVFGSGVQPGVFHSPNWFGARTPPMFARDGRLFIVAGSMLYAFDMKSGKELWKTGKLGGFMPKQRYESPVRAIVPSERGLVVFGYELEEGQEKDPWVDLVDPASGDFRLKKPVRVFKKSISERLMKASGRRHLFTVVGGAAYVAGGDRIERVDLGKGEVEQRESPGGSRAIVHLEGHEGDLFVRGQNWMGLVDTDSGSTVYRRSFEAPERSVWDQSLDGAFALGKAYARQEAVQAFAKATADEENFVRNAAAAEAYRRRNLEKLDDRLAEIARGGSVSAADARAHAFFFAGDGERGSSVRNIEKVRKSDGKTVATVPIDTQALEVSFVVDSANDRLYINDGSAIFSQSIGSK